MAEEYVASIQEGRPWVTYSPGNNGEPNFYRDVLDEYGNALYCDGEVCKLIPWEHPEEHQNEVFMTNEDNGVAWFIISREQFEADFVKCAGGGERNVIVQ